MKNKILKEINVDEIMEEIKKNPKENRRFKVFWNGKKIEVDLEYYDFEKEIDEIKEKLENGFIFYSPCFFYFDFFMV